MAKRHYPHEKAALFIACARCHVEVVDTECDWQWTPTVPRPTCISLDYRYTRRVVEPLLPWLTVRRLFAPHACKVGEDVWDDHLVLSVRISLASGIVDGMLTWLLFRPSTALLRATEHVGKRARRTGEICLSLQVTAVAVLTDVSFADSQSDAVTRNLASCSVAEDSKTSSKQGARTSLAAMPLLSHSD